MSKEVTVGIRQSHTRMLFLTVRKTPGVSPAQIVYLLVDEFLGGAVSTCVCLLGFTLQGGSLVRLWSPISYNSRGVRPWTKQKHKGPRTSRFAVGDRTLFPFGLLSFLFKYVSDQKKNID